MKFNLNLTELKTVTYQPCAKCAFDKLSNHNYCGLLPKICLTDGQIYTPIETLSDIFKL